MCCRERPVREGRPILRYVAELDPLARRPRASTAWSPTHVPPRTAWMPISVPGEARASLAPMTQGTAAVSAAGPSASRASASAVPEGAVRFDRWCARRSRRPSPRQRREGRPEGLAQRQDPRLKLGSAQNRDLPPRRRRPPRARRRARSCPRPARRPRAGARRGRGARRLRVLRTRSRRLPGREDGGESGPQGSPAHAGGRRDPRTP